jgi:hypothetical protein
MAAETNQQIARIAAVQKKYSDQLLKKKYVVGVSIGPASENGKDTGDWALIVLVDRLRSPEQLAPEDRIPSELDGVRVIVEEIGILNAQRANW